MDEESAWQRWNQCFEKKYAATKYKRAEFTARLKEIHLKNNLYVPAEEDIWPPPDKELQ